MRRRLFFVGSLAGALLLLGAAPAAGHGIGGRVDLPVPRGLFIWGAALAVVVSFIALGVLWREPRLEEGAPERPLPPWIQRLFGSPVAEWAVRLASLTFFILVLLAAAAGDESAGRNIAPLSVYVWFWVGLAFAHAVFGNLWAALSPWDTLARLLDLGREPRREYPKPWGKWPAAFLLFGFVWLELAFPNGDSPRVLAVAIAAYTAVTLGGMAVFGREAWNRSGEAFAVYFGLLARIAPFARDRRGRMVVRPVLGGLPGLAPEPGVVALLMVVIGSTTFDGFSSSSAWLSVLDGLSRPAEGLVSTAGLIGMILAVALAYTVAMGAAAAVARRPWHWHPLAVRFVHSLVPIAFAYAVAHYFSLLVLEGQQGVSLLADPLGLGWNVIGTASFRANLALVSPLAVWYVQVGAIVAGHVGGVVLAHDRSVAVFPSSTAVRTQYALLAVMVLFTVGGLVLLSGA